MDRLDLSAVRSVAPSRHERYLTMSSRTQYDSVIDDDDELWYVYIVLSCIVVCYAEHDR